MSFCNIKELKNRIKLGDYDACYEIGQAYAEGEVVKMSNKAAYKYYKLGSNNGNAKCLYGLAVCYECGYWVSKDLGKAKELYNIAFAPLKKQAEQGDKESQFCIGVYYQYGNMCIEKDLAEAKVWYEKSALQGKSKAEYKLACIYDKEGEDTKAFEWYKKAAEHRHCYAKCKLAIFYFSGRATPINKSKAMQYFGEVDGKKFDGQELIDFFLGRGYYTGEGVTMDRKKGIKYLRKSIKAGCIEAKSFCRANSISIG